MLRGSLVSLCLLGLAACAAAPAGPGSAPPSGARASSAGANPSLAGTRWVGVLPQGIDSRAAPRLEFVSGGRMTGFTGCNMLSGTWRMEGGEVRFGGIATTKRLCLGPEGEVEKRLLAALGDDSRARREGARLVLASPGGARFELTAVE
jgi:heat shock protein HslJ